MMARPAGFEPTTPWFVAKYSIQLSYGRKGAEFIIGCALRVTLNRCIERRSERSIAADEILPFEIDAFAVALFGQLQAGGSECQRKRFVLDQNLALQFFV